MYREFFRLAVRNIRYRGKRSWLTILGTMIGIAAVVSLLSIGQGLEASVQSEFEELGGDKVFVSPGAGGPGARFSGTTAELTDDDVDVIGATQGVDRVAGRVAGSVQAEYDDETQFISILGVTTDSDLVRESLNIEIEEGRYIRETDTSGLVVGSSAAEDLFDDEIIVRTKIGIQGQDYRVVGVTESAGNPQVDGGVIMPIDQARELLDKPESYDAIVAEVRSGLEPSEVEENIAENLRNSRNVQEGEEDFSTQTADDIIRSFQDQFAIIQSILLGIGAISLLVGGVGIMNTMYTSVTERTREIGVMKAIGATKRQILTLFLIESGIIGLIGGLIGIIIGLGMSAAATALITQQLSVSISPYISAQLVVGSLAFAFIVGAISGGLPAREASKLKPAEALRYKK